MNIVMHEVRKLWNVRMLLVVALLCGLFYFMNMDWSVRHSQATTSMEAVLLRELSERYGTRATDAQMAAFFARQFPMLIAELEYRMDLDPDFAAVGLFTYVDFINANQM